MQSNLSKRVNELLVLAVLDDEPSHGYQIALHVEERTGGRFTFQHGTLYPILHRLEKQGRVKGEWESGGRRRKRYGITAQGRASLDEETARLRDEVGALFALLEESDDAAA
ncbi:MAG: helix-turn-helix transcriptional regulator [Gemmatimonadota bacterium]|nr:helix-turn-helix transcriptional regulator [Gemmatimonadota bacterium]